MAPHPARQARRQRPRRARPDHRPMRGTDGHSRPGPQFASMLCNQRGEHLEAWADHAEASPVSELRGFRQGDFARTGPPSPPGSPPPYNSGAVEGHVNRIKMIERQMYGRAKPDLLRKRVLLADLTVTTIGPSHFLMSLDRAVRSCFSERAIAAS